VIFIGYDTQYQFIKRLNMKKNKILFSSLAALALLTNNLNAEETTLLDEVNVWETQVISSSLNLGKETIETKQADHLSDLLRDLPGVDVGGSHSMNNKIVIRGVKDEHLDVRIDGAKQPSVDMFHHQSTLKLNPDILKKVNIEVGANSVVHGGLGGSLEFETKDGKDLVEDGKTFGGIISTNYNSNKSIGASLALAGKVTDNSDLFVYYSYVDNENWKTGNGTKEEGRDGEIDDIILKYGVDIDDSQRISVSYDKLTDEGDYLPRPNFSTAANVAIGRGNIQPTEYVRDTYTIKHNINKGDNLLLNTSLYMNKMDLTREENGNNRRGNILNAIVENKGLTSKGQTNIESGPILNTLTYGAEYDHQTSEVTADGVEYGDDETSKTIVLYVEDAIDFDNGLLLTPGIRFTNYKLNGIVGDFNENELTYSLATEYALTENLSLLASYTTLFKGVPMQEVFASYRTWLIENNDIKSETGNNKEIGFRYLQDNVLAADDIGFLVKYYITDMDDDIGYDSSSNMVNLGETQTKGVEASFAYNLRNFNALLSYSHMDSEVKYTGQALDVQAGDKISLNLNYQVTPKLEASWKSILVLDEHDVTSSSGVDKKEGYNIHDIAFNYQPSSFKGLKVIAGIDNVFDKHYAAHSSYYAVSSRYGDMTDYEAGRNFKVTLAYKF
jgi:hemoglobin/transferrin/lactoferrin receptor protein